MITCRLEPTEWGYLCEAVLDLHYCEQGASGITMHSDRPIEADCCLDAYTVRRMGGHIEYISPPGSIDLRLKPS